jgi:branched-chain amino acid transport system ATP-binding protein
VGRQFGVLAALVDVNLKINIGERRAIIGTNGAGKTTLFNTISGDFLPSSGSIVLSDIDITHLEPQKRIQMGLRRTYQTPLLLNDLTVNENLYIAVRGVQAGRLKIWRDSNHMQNIEEVKFLAEKIGIQKLLAERTRELSHGQRRLVEIAMALAGEPKLLMLDEPAAGLSQGERVELSKLLSKLPLNLTIMLIEHDMEMALGFANVVTVLHSGRIICEGDPTFVASNKLVHDVYMGNSYV